MNAETLRRPAYSPWAVASLLCSVVFFCPFTAILGPVLGLWALRDIHRTNRRGTGLAFTGLTLGAVFTGCWVAVPIWVDSAIRRPIQQGPRNALIAGWTGDLEAFKAGFVGPGAESSDQAAQQFLSNLSNRYGRFVSIQQDPLGVSDDQSSLLRDGHARLSYQFEFSNGQPKAFADYVLRDEKQGFVSRFRYFAVFGRSGGPLVYPPSLAEKVIKDRQALQQQQVTESIEEDVGETNGEQSDSSGGSGVR